MDGERRAGAEMGGGEVGVAYQLLPWEYSRHRRTITTFFGPEMPWGLFSLVTDQDGVVWMVLQWDLDGLGGQSAMTLATWEGIEVTPYAC